MTESRNTFRHRLEIGTNVVVLIVALLVIGILVKNYFGTSPNRPTDSGLKKGISFGPLADSVNFTASPKTLLLFLSTHCKYCEKSLPFYSVL